MNVNQCITMGTAMSRPPHHLRKKALQLMKNGLATQKEIAEAVNVSIGLVTSWRVRAQIKAGEIRRMRVARVRRLLLGKEANDDQGPVVELSAMQTPRPPNSAPENGVPQI